MKLSSGRHLRLVTYVPDDLSLGASLAKAEGEQFEDQGEISAALSLYFQWARFRSARFTSVVSKISTACELDYDKDEAAPSELYLKFSSDNPSHSVLEGEDVVVIFEVFNVAYKYSATVLSVVESELGKLVVTTLPSRLVVKKLRALPRVVVPRSDASFECRWHTSAHHSPKIGKVENLGITALAFHVFEESITDGTGEIELQGLRIRGEITVSGNRGVVRLIFENQSEFGTYFELFRRFAFPTIVPRKEVNLAQLYEAYKATGFFEKYVNTNSPEENTKYFQLLKETWENLSNAHHDSVADYCSVNEEGAIVGASSLVRAFRNGNRDAWVITQLCTRSEPAYFQNTYDLYLWRVAYLFGIPGDFDITCWIDGNSRFLERLWVKFIRHLGRIDETYWPVKIRLFQKSKVSELHKVESYKIGTFERRTLCEDGLIGSVDPPYLNFGKLLDHVAAIPPESKTPGALIEYAESLSAASSNPEVCIRITTPENCNDQTLDSLPQILLNRFCFFRKSDLPFLYSSILHSLAVMERKHQRDAS